MLLRNKREGVVYGVALLSLLTQVCCLSCTVCSSEDGRKIREGISSYGFTSTFLTMAVPVPILLGAAVVISNILGTDKKR
jgi:hypothetical protein